MINKFIHPIVLLRYVFTVGLISLVYTETGVWTSLALLLIAVAIELFLILFRVVDDVLEEVNKNLDEIIKLFESE